MTIPLPTRAWHALTCAALVLAACKPTPKDRVALVGATLIDGTGGAPRNDVVILVHGTRIEDIVPHAEFQLPKTAVEVDVSGQWIIPGLIDAHGHTARWTFPRYLAFGVTTVRDLHNQRDSILTLRDRVNLGGMLAPRLYIAGSMLELTFDFNTAKTSPRSPATPSGEPALLHPRKRDLEGGLA
jgi:hypothetical protein